MKRLYLALGNPLRGDDGVAARVLDLLGPGQGRKLTLHQLTPEVAADLQGVDEAFFIDADPAAYAPRIERIDPGPHLPAGSHTASPGAIVHLARRLFGYQGDAYLCRVPARDFPFREQLSAEAEAQAHAAAELLREFAAPPMTKSG
jgi:hydrogenase maturation protease